MKLGVDGRTALVTGGTRGIGMGISRALLAEGVTVIAVGRNAAVGEEFRATLRAEGLPADFICSDVTDPAAVDALAAAVRAKWPRIDIVVNNVGGLMDIGGGPRGVIGIPPQEWIGTFTKTVVSAMNVCARFVPAMQDAGWGRIVNIASIAATEPPVTTPADYGAAKAALRNATFSLAHALGGSGITVNSVSPGPVLTDELVTHIRNIAATRGWTGDFAALERHYLAEIRPNAVGRLGRPEDIGAIVAFLASDLASYITAADIRADGGVSRSVA